MAFTGTELQSCGQDYVAWFSQEDTSESDLYTYVPVAVFYVDIYELPKLYRMTQLEIIIHLLQITRRESK